MKGWRIGAIAWVVLVVTSWGAAHSQDYTLLEAANGGAVGVCTTMDGTKVRCRKFNPRETPAPTARPTPRPTVAPLPCEPIGTKTFVVGQDRMFCFTAAPGSTFVAIEATSPANAGCAYLKLSLVEPSGHTSYGEGAYPIKMSEEPRVVGGRYYFWVSPQWISDAPGCGTFQMMVR